MTGRHNAFIISRIIKIPQKNNPLGVFFNNIFIKSSHVKVYCKLRDYFLTLRLSKCTPTFSYSNYIHKFLKSFLKFIYNGWFRHRTILCRMRMTTGKIGGKTSRYTWSVSSGFPILEMLRKLAEVLQGFYLDYRIFDPSSYSPFLTAWRRGTSVSTIWSMGNKSCVYDVC